MRTLRSEFYIKKNPERSIASKTGYALRGIGASKTWRDNTQIREKTCLSLIDIHNESLEQEKLIAKKHGCLIEIQEHSSFRTKLTKKLLEKVK